MIKLRLAQNNDQTKWDDFVLNHEYPGPYCLFAWRNAVLHAYHHEPCYLIAEDKNEQIRGVLPMIYVKPPLIKGILVSLPFCDYGGILAADTEARGMLIEGAVEQAVTRGAGLEIRCRDIEPQLSEKDEFRVRSNKVRMIMGLPENSELLWDQFKSKLRSQIRRPIKEGLTCKLGSDFLINDFYGVMCRNMRDLGSPVHSRTWFEAVIKAFGKSALVGVVYKGDKAIGGGVILCCGDMVTIPWASTLREYNSISPNMLLYWEFLKYSADNGYRFFDFGRSTPDEGTYKFKQQWGAVPSPLYWYSPDDCSADTGENDNYLRELVEKIWSRIPQQVTDTMGPYVRRYITL